MSVRLSLTAVALLGLVACGGGDEGAPVGGGTIRGPWVLATVGGKPVPTLLPRTTILIDHASANFSDPGFTMTYVGTSEGESQIIIINGTWSLDGDTYRLFGSTTINGVYASGYGNGAGVMNGVLTQYASPIETWVRP